MQFGVSLAEGIGLLKTRQWSVGRTQLVALALLFKHLVNYECQQ